MQYETYENKRQVLSPDEYLNLKNHEKENIKYSRIIPASLDNRNDFGSIEVIKKYSTYEVKI